MATTEQWHNEVTASIGGAEKYGQGIWPNPWVEKMTEYQRRHEQRDIIAALSHKILMLSEPRFITSGETSEMMEALITMIGAKKILELGMHTGRSTLHFLRAIVGIPGAKVVSIDARPTHDRIFFSHFEAAGQFQFISGWTPECLNQLAGQSFDFVFVDSDHSVEHSQKELAALLPLTAPGSLICFHDCPAWKTPSQRVAPPVREWLHSLIQAGQFTGLLLPSPNQLDCEEEYGKGYDSRCNPGLAVLMRQ